MTSTKIASEKFVTQKRACQNYKLHGRLNDVDKSKR